ncbi:MAG: calcium-binding protein, partial [Burkholderiales bacterium]
MATHDPYLLDTISAHKIETGFYYPLTEYVLSATDGFAEAVEGGYLSNSDLNEYYLPLTSLQKVASVMGNLFRQDETSTAGGLAQLLIGGLGAVIGGDRNEVNQLVDAYIDTRYLAGKYENNESEYLIARDTDWAFRLRVGAAALGIAPYAPGPFGLAFGFFGALALQPVFKLVESISSDQADFLLRDKFQSHWIGDKLPDSQPEEVLQRSDMLGAALQVSDPRGSGDRLATVGDLARGAEEELAEAMVDENGNWYGDTAAFLITRANELGEQTRLPQAEQEFWSYSRRAAAGNAQLLSDINTQSLGFLSDWQTLLAAASPDLIAPQSSSFTVAGLDTYEQKKTFLDVALNGLEGMLDIFVGTAHAEEFHAAAAQALDEARAAAQSVVIRQGRSLNSFATTDFDPAAAASLGALAAGSVRTFTLYLPFDAGSGGQRVRLTLAGGAADRLALLDQADEVALGADDVFTLVVPEGRSELSFSLRAQGDIDAGATLELKAQLVQLADGVELATHNEHVELELALEGVDEVIPVTTREIRGDWAPKPWTDPVTGVTYAYKLDDLGNVERQPGVPSTGQVETDQWLDGSGGADYIVTGDFDQQASGGGGDDFIVGSDASGNVLAGGAGDDWIEGGGWADHAAQYLEWDYLGRRVALGDDKIYGGAGDDQIWGERQADQAALDDPGVAPTGLPGDWLTGGSGNDRIYGSAGDDVLLGGVGEDLLLGGAGADVLLGDDDFQIRPEGNYWQVVRPGPGGFEVGLFPVISALLSVPDDIFPLTGDPYLAYYKDGGGADVLNGGAGDDILLGQAGDDTLYGGEGDDILAGWEGDDELIGGAGDDLIAGDFGRYEQVNQRTAPDTLLVSAG